MKRFFAVRSAHALAVSACLCCLVCCVCCVWCGLGHAGEPAAAAVSRDMVWAAGEGAGQGRGRAIWFSTQERNGGWTEPLRLSEDNGADNLLPCIVSDPAGKKHAVWVTRNSARLALAHAAFDGTAWSAAEPVPGLPRDATMPFVALDDAGVLWLVFAGNDGQDQDDILCVRLQDGQWSKPERVNGENDVPDINPYIEIGRDGGIQVTWEGFRDGSYILLSAQRQDAGWTAEQVLSPVELDGLRQGRRQFAEEPLPAFVKDRSMLFIRNNNL